MTDLYLAELLKSKRSFQRPFLFIGPILFGILLIFAINLAPNSVNGAWEHYTKMIFNMWTTLFNTLGISMLCIFSESREEKNKLYRVYFVETKNLKNLWLTKLIAQMSYSLFASLLLCLFVSGIVVVKHLDLSAFGTVFAMGGASWLASVSVIPLVLFLTFRFGTIASLIFGGLGLVTGTIMGAGQLWFLNPYSYAIRAIIPFTKLQPNSMKLEMGSQLGNLSNTALSLLLAILICAILTMITAQLFEKTEVGL